MRIVSEKTLDAFRGPGLCEWCKKLVRAREPHHLYGRGHGGGFRLDVRINLVALCAVFSGGDNCHAEVHAGKIMRCDLLAIVAAREGCLQVDIEDALARLRMAPKGSDVDAILKAVLT